MATIRHLANAPITEALFDFQVSLPAASDVAVFAALRDRLRERYPSVQERRSFQATFAFGGDKPRLPEAKFGDIDGYVFATADRLNVAQFRLDGFTLNRLAPYTSWDALVPQALELWDTYVQVARPEALTRLAVRYINRLQVPAVGDLSRYLAVLPPRSPGAPQYLSRYLMRVGSHDPETGFLANITQALEPKPGTAEASVILDIDIYTTRRLDLESSALIPILSTMRTIKNQVFFGSITDETARQYE